MNNCYYYLLVFFLLQRLHEVWLTTKNESKIKLLGLQMITNKSDVKPMLLIHSSWFISLLIESPHELPSWLSNPLTLITFYTILVFFQLVRWHTQQVLGIAWLIYPAKIASIGTIRKGIYHFIHHPNYYVVMGEFLIIPLLGGRMHTLIIFLPLVIFQLIKRISIEEKLHQAASSIIICISLLHFITFPLNMAHAENKNLDYKYTNYEESSKAPNILWFDGISKKLGFIKTHFVGYPQNFSIKMNQSGTEIKDITLEIDATSFSTDNDSRDKKMKELCLSVDKFKLVKAEVKGPITLPKEENQAITQTVLVTLTIRNITKEISVELKTEKKGSNVFLEGQTTISLKAFEVPDPSITIASVSDELIVGIKLNVQQ